MPWYLYIVEARDKSLYTGITTNIKSRIEKHNNGLGSKSLLGKRPVILRYQEEFTNRSEASKREFEIKKWSRANKLRLIKKQL